MLAIGLDEKLLRRLSELDDAKAVSTRRRGTDAKWKLDPRDVPGTRFLFWILFLFHPATNFTVVEYRCLLSDRMPKLGSPLPHSLKVEARSAKSRASSSISATRE